MIKEYSDLTALDIVSLIGDRKITAVETAQTALDLTENEGRRLNAVVNICHEKAIRQARAVDRKIEKGDRISPLAGVPVILKDNIVYSGYPSTCGSRMLENYIPPYDSTCALLLEKAGAIIIAKANMDEFGMGSSNEFSAFGPVMNPHDEGTVPGGSSGGSAASVAAGIVPIAIGSDTGGSVRQPAGFCGVVGLKPTYGAVSRYGLVAFASSTDQIGPIAGSVADCALAFEIIAGYDNQDSTSVDSNHPPYSKLIVGTENKKFRFGLPKECFTNGLNNEVRKAVEKAMSILEISGHSFREISLPHTGEAVAAYYVIADAEASSNLARFDGIRYGRSSSTEEELKRTYSASRSEGLGLEVMRRIILGTYVLSAGHYDRYYQKACRVRDLIRRDFTNVFEKVDMVITPTSPTAAFRLGEKIDDPLSMYLSDIYTIPASLAGIPAISIPCGRTKDNRPIGLQMIAPAFGEGDLLTAAFQAERLLEFNNAEN